MPAQDFEGHVFLWGGSDLEAMKVLKVGNMLIDVGTSLAIFIISTVFTVDLIISFFTLCMVVATVINTAGLLHFWGVTIDAYFTVILLLL